jgi:hypothetical protein
VTGEQRGCAAVDAQAGAGEPGRSGASAPGQGSALGRGRALGRAGERAGCGDEAARRDGERHGRAPPREAAHAQGRVRGGRAMAGEGEVGHAAGGGSRGGAAPRPRRRGGLRRPREREGGRPRRAREGEGEGGEGARAAPGHLERLCIVK